MQSTKRCPFCAEEILAAAIKCKHCGSELKATAADQETTPRLSLPVKRVIALLAAIFVVVLVIGHNSGHDDPHPAVETPSPEAPATTAPDENNLPQPMADAPAPAPAEPVRNIFRTSAAALYKGYAANEVAMNDKIGDSVIEVTGTIKSIDEVLHDIVLHLVVSDDNSFESVGLTLANPDRPSIARLQKGQRIVAQCLQMRRGVMDDPLGSDCTLQHVSPAPATQEQEAAPQP
jgi:hypothetical protein